MPQSAAILPADAEPASQNGAANTALLAYMVLLFFAGLGLLYATFVKGWGAGGWLGGGAMLVASVSMLVVRLRGGMRFLEVDCPACGAHQTVSDHTADHAFPCTSCFSYMEQTEGTVTAVPAEFIDDCPIFEAALPADEPHWDGCTLCASNPCEAETIRGSVRIGKRRVTTTMSVPVCHLHRGQRAVELGQGRRISGGVSGFAMRFRSHAAALRFREANPMPLRVTGRLTFGD